MSGAMQMNQTHIIVDCSSLQHHRLQRPLDCFFHWESKSSLLKKPTIVIAPTHGPSHACDTGLRYYFEYQTQKQCHLLPQKQLKNKSSIAKHIATFSELHEVWFLPQHQEPRPHICYTHWLTTPSSIFWQCLVHAKQELI